MARAEDKLDVRFKDGWFDSYVDGKRVARFYTRQAAEAACRRMQRPEGRTAKHPGWRTSKVART